MFLKNFDYNLTAHILIRYGQKYIAQWEINTKRKHKRAKDHLHNTHFLRHSRSQRLIARYYLHWNTLFDILIFKLNTVAFQVSVFQRAVDIYKNLL